MSRAARGRGPPSRFTSRPAPRPPPPAAAPAPAPVPREDRGASGCTRSPLPKPKRGGGETILVVEDELDLRDLVHTLLEAFGYRVLVAEHGKDALEVWKKAEGKIDLVLTDVTMPEGISGLELAERFRKEKPDLKVIFSSGYSVELFERQKVVGLREGLNFLPKPYQPDTLALDRPPLPGFVTGNPPRAGLFLLESWRVFIVDTWHENVRATMGQQSRHSDSARVCP